MKKKLFVFGITVAFVVSTIGLPLTVHFCEMMKENPFAVCEICKMEEERKFSCCEEETEKLQITSAAAACCQEDLTLSKIEDEFLTAKTESIFFPDFVIAIIPNQNIDLNENIFHSLSSFNDSSPPGDESKPIYIFNASLLI